MNSLALEAKSRNKVSGLLLFRKDKDVLSLLFFSFNSFYFFVACCIKNEKRSALGFQIDFQMDFHRT